MAADSVSSEFCFAICGEVLVLLRFLVNLDYLFGRRFLLRIGRVGRQLHGDMSDLHLARILDEQIAMLIVVILNLRLGRLHVMRAKFVVEHLLDHHRAAHLVHQQRIGRAARRSRLAFAARNLELARALRHLAIGNRDLASRGLLQQQLPID